MLTFSIPRLTADRLARLSLACDDGTPTSTLAHIGLRVTPTAVRFSATNGRILASLVVPVDDCTGVPGDVLLDAGQITAALKLTAKASSGRIACRIDDVEARLTNGTASTVVRRVGGTFPAVDHVWTRPAGMRWVPAMSCLDPHLVALAQRITGSKQPILFSSPIDPAMHLERLWVPPGADDHAQGVSLAALRAAVVAPAYWADHELAILVMPITRGGDERQVDLAGHALVQAQPAALAA